MPTEMLTGSRLPPALSDLQRPVPALYVRGELPRGPIVALVGTRHPSRLGKRFAYTLARSLAERGIVVASGGAEGIDSAAHLGALRAQGRTLVVAPAGFARPFPNDNRKLFEAIVGRGGCYASLFPDDVAAHPSAFFIRNGVLAALSRALVVVEAPLRSGARNAARHARRLGRPVFAVPHFPRNSRGRGCNAELRRGARMLESPEDLMSYLAQTRQHALPLPKRKDRVLPLKLRTGEPDSGRDLGLVQAAIDSGARSAEKAVERAGIPARRVQVALLTLCLQGRIALRKTGEIVPLA